MNELQSELSSPKKPAMVSAVAVGVGLGVRKLFGTSTGMSTHNFTDVAKVFALITISGGLVNWYNSGNGKRPE